MNALLPWKKSEAADVSRRAVDTWTARRRAVISDSSGAGRGNVRRGRQRRRQQVGETDYALVMRDRHAARGDVSDVDRQAAGTGHDAAWVRAIGVRRRIHGLTIRGSRRVMPAVRVGGVL
ncbi:MAG TPA: hypothetical protein VFZ73_14290 [Gemmatimonadaceae bacterium]